MRIDSFVVCEPAGPGFDRNATFQRQNMPMASARNVQCVHTSSDKGTALRLCHQNWNMGRCGWSQPAAAAPPLGSHGLCPFLFVHAFENPYRAVRRPDECPLPLRPEMAGWQGLEESGDGYFMGYDEKRTR